MADKLVFIETYGCTANQNNSEILAGILNSAGFIVTNNPEIAEIIILNTCTVKSKTESKIKRRIQDLSKEYPKKLIIIAGCMPETDAKKLKKLAPSALLLGTHHIRDILNLIRDYQENKLDWKKQESYLMNQNEIKLNLPKKPQNQLISIHQISEGCLENCSYCKARLAKGKLFSYSEGEIIKSIESDLQNGAKEVWLTSQDNAAYGLDKGKQTLANLLKGILGLKHRFKLRLGMMNPNNVLPILESLIEIYKDKKMFKFLHIPVQSASNSILKHMNRFYTIEQAKEIIKKFRKEFPDAIIATDMIVGYPAETEEAHAKNIKFTRECAPDVLNISKFSRHKGTAAEKFGRLSSATIKKRTKELMAAHRETAKEKKQKCIGKILKVLIDKKVAGSENLYKARDENYNIVVVKCKKENFGKEIAVRIIGAGVHHLIGELIPGSSEWQ